MNSHYNSLFTFALARLELSYQTEWYLIIRPTLEIRRMFHVKQFGGVNKYGFYWSAYNYISIGWYGCQQVFSNNSAIF